MFEFIYSYRGIGDVSLQPYISSEAEIMEKDLTADDLFLVLASDGIWVSN